MAGRKDTILITGIGGFVGRMVAAEALERGYKVRGTLRSIEKRGRRVTETLAALGADTSRLTLHEADLLRDEGWAEAARGCRHLVHIASPMNLTSPRDRMAYVPEARDGSLRVLEAARAAGVKRAVVTSSIAAAIYGHDAPPDRVFTEADWTNIDHRESTGYTVSKTLAEKAVWDYAAAHKDLEIVTLLPALMFGPLPEDRRFASSIFIRRLLNGNFPAAPHFHMPVVDCRDVAAAHLAALETKKAAGERVLIVAGELSVKRIGDVVAAQYPRFARRMPRFEIPDWLVRVIALHDGKAREIATRVGKTFHASNEKSRKLLGMSYHAPEEAVIAMVRSLVEFRGENAKF